MSEAGSPSVGACVPCGSRGEARWYCAWTHPQEEIRAHRELCQQDFEAFLPMIRRERRADEAGKPASEAVIAMFPRYLFVRFNPLRDAWGCIRSTRGVGGLICHGVNLPTPLPVGWVERLIERTSGRGVVDDSPLLSPLIDAGTALRLADGGVLGDELVGICQWSSAKRVRMLITIMGRQVPLTVPRSAVEAV